MVLKCWHNYLKAAREVFVMLFLKKRFKANLFLTLDQYKIKNNKLNITNTSNIENDFQIWFWNKSANKSNLNLKKEGNYENDRENENLEKKHSKTEGKTSSEVLKQELK